MAGGALPVLLGSAACAAGVAALRLGWARPRRSAALNGLSWGSLAGGLVLLGWAEGAWGVAIGALAAMLTAGMLLAAAARNGGNGARRGRAAEEPALPGARSPLALGRRAGVFLLVVPGGFAAAILIALAGLAVAREAGWREPDALALAFYLFPLAWAIIALALMLRARLRPALAGLSGIAAASAGLAWMLT